MDEREKDLGPNFDMSQDVSNTAGREDAQTGSSCEQEKTQTGQYDMSQIQMESEQNEFGSTVQKSAEHLKETAKGAAEQVKHEAKQIQHKMDEALSDSTETVAHTIDSVCQCLRTSAEESESKHPMFGKYVRTAADSMEKFSESLKHKDVDFFVHSTEDMARKQPGIFLGGAFTMGFALGRLLKGISHSGISPARGEMFHDRQDTVPVTSQDDSDIWRNE